MSEKIDFSKKAVLVPTHFDADNAPTKGIVIMTAHVDEQVFNRAHKDAPMTKEEALAYRKKLKHKFGRIWEEEDENGQKTGSYGAKWGSRDGDANCGPVTFIEVILGDS